MPNTNVEDEELHEKIEAIIFARFYDMPEKQRKTIVSNLEKLIAARERKAAITARLDELSHTTWFNHCLCHFESLDNGAKEFTSVADRESTLEAELISTKASHE